VAFPLGKFAVSKGKEKGVFAAVLYWFGS